MFTNEGSGLSAVGADNSIYSLLLLCFVVAFFFPPHHGFVKTLLVALV
jgi:hypothetical protein